MRDRDAYTRLGRNDPLSPQQLREHPYDFVSLPDRPARGDAVGHDRYAAGRLTGTLRFVYETLAPLHVGSGAFETAEECGLKGGALPVRGIVRRQGRPVLPGSGWKGAVRARYDRSRLGLVDDRSREPAFKVPDELKGPDTTHNVKITDRRVTGALRPAGVVWSPEKLKELSPGEALFGCMGYRGRVHPGDGEIEGGAAREPLQVAPLDSPVMHRLAKPGRAKNTGGRDIEISEVEGRKFYYDGDVVHVREMEEAAGTRKVYEYVDSVAPGATLTIEVHVDSLSLAELGALLLSAGYGEEVGIVRFGGFKSVGLGKVRLRDVAARLASGSPVRTWRRRNDKVDDFGPAIDAARRGVVDARALSELDEVTRRRRPEEKR